MLCCAMLYRCSTHVFDCSHSFIQATCRSQVPCKLTTCSPSFSSPTNSSPPNPSPPILFRHFPVLQIPPLRRCPTFSSRALSTPVFWLSVISSPANSSHPTVPQLWSSRSKWSFVNCDKTRRTDSKAVFTLSYMYGVHIHVRHKPYMYDSVNTA